ncbi:MAG: nuclear transport factor 2 family protein [Dehalococcoidia bacterium]
MQPEEMDRLIEQHLKAEFAGDAAGCVAMYTDDVVHDVVGWPSGPMNGKEAAKSFYDQLVQDINSQDMKPVQRYYGPNFAVIEHIWNGTVPGIFLGVPGNGRKISFRMLHLWEFRDGRICRENVWLDGGGALAQLTGS